MIANGSNQQASIIATAIRCDEVVQRLSVQFGERFSDRDEINLKTIRA
jgi:hypothetical protein